MKIVSNKLRQSARGQDCAVRLPGVCNFNPETTVLAHVSCGHRGMGIKGPDLIAVFACSACHDAIDRRTQARVDPHDLIRAIAETQMKWVELGLLKVQ